MAQANLNAHSSFAEIFMSGIKLKSHSATFKCPLQQASWKGASLSTEMSISGFILSSNCATFNWPQ